MNKDEDGQKFTLWSFLWGPNIYEQAVFISKDTLCVACRAKYILLGADATKLTCV